MGWGGFQVFHLGGRLPSGADDLPDLPCTAGFSISMLGHTPSYAMVILGKHVPSLRATLDLYSRDNMWSMLSMGAEVAKSRGPAAASPNMPRFW